MFEQGKIQFSEFSTGKPMHAPKWVSDSSCRGNAVGGSKQQSPRQCRKAAAALQKKAPNERHWLLNAKKNPCRPSFPGAYAPGCYIALSALKPPSFEPASKPMLKPQK
jgi:hypothetical protein